MMVTGYCKAKFLQTLRRAPLICVLFYICVFWLSGCTAFREPLPAQLPARIPTTWAADVDVEKLPITTGLLDLLGEQPVLRQLIDEALTNNPNLQATALRLKAAGYMLAGSRAKQLPQATAEFSKGRDNQNIDVETGKNKMADTHQLSLGVSWELDIWGRLADEHKASQQSVLAQQYEYLHIRDALVARVIQAWIAQTAIRRSVDIDKKRIAFLQRTETLLSDRYQSGIGDIDALSAAKSRTEIAKADLSARRAALRRAIRKLEVLIGRYPKGEVAATIDLPEIKSPPVSIPATVLLKRPDVQAALARLEAASNTSRAADKAVLPELRLSAQVFRQAANLHGLGDATSSWNLLGSLFQPLFSGGRIANTSKALRTEAEAALMDLRAVVLQALKEVEDAFDAERNLARQIQALNVAVSESAASSRYYESRYKQGLDSIQSQLIAKAQEMAVRIRQNELVAERWSNRIVLALALGVGMGEGVDAGVTERTSITSEGKK